MYSPSGSDSVSPSSPLSPTLFPFPETSVWSTIKLLVYSLLLENYDIDACSLEIVWEDFQDLDECADLVYRMISDISKFPDFPSLFTITRLFSAEILNILETVTQEHDQIMNDRADHCRNESQIYFSLHSYDHSFFVKYQKLNVLSARCTPFSQSAAQCCCAHHALETPTKSENVAVDYVVLFPFTEADWCRLLELERGSDGDVEAYIWKQTGHLFRQHAVAAEAAVIGRQLFLSEELVTEVIQSVQELDVLKQIIQDANLFPNIVKHSEDPRTFECLLDRAYGYLMQHSPRTAELWIRSHFTCALEARLKTLADNASASTSFYSFSGTSATHSHFPSSVRLVSGSISPSTSSEISITTPYEYHSSWSQDDAEKNHSQNHGLVH